MKKVVLCIMAAALITSSFAEYKEKFSLLGSVGAGFRVGGELFTTREYNAISVTPVKEDDKFLNYGSGLKLNLGARAGLADNLAAQAEFAMTFGVPSFVVETNRQNVSNFKTTYKRSMYGVKVSIIPKFEFIELINMYTGVGIGFYWTSMHYESSISAGSLSQNEKGKIVASPALGFNGMLGADFPLTEKIIFFGEIAFEQTNFKWKKQIVDETTIAGNQVGTTFYEEDDSNTANEDPVSVPGSNWQLKVGIRFGLF